MSVLAVRRGRERIVVWARRSWESMPHRTSMLDASDGTVTTACGRHVLLGDGADRIAITAVSADIFVAAGCGLCTCALIGDLRRDLAESRPEARDRMRHVLDRAKWVSS